MILSIQWNIELDEHFGDFLELGLVRSRINRQNMKQSLTMFVQLIHFFLIFLTTNKNQRSLQIGNCASGLKYSL